MKKQRENKGITLIALVITIIILLILAGISISSLTNNGLFGKAQDADKQTEIAQIKEDIQLGIYEKQLSNLGTISDEELESILKGRGTVNYEDDGTIKGITTEKGYEIPISEIYTGKITLAPKTLARVVNVGDYVAYTPDTVTTEAHNELIEELGTYSGNTDTAYNTTTTTKQDTLNWRVLDIVKDENGNDCVRLISATPTTSTVCLPGSTNTKGYNNAVYLLDKTCKTFYNKTGYAKNVQNLKIEDIEKYLTYDYTSYEINANGTTRKYGDTMIYTCKGCPSIFAKEKTGWVDGVQGTELGLSEQTTPINEDSTQVETSIKVTLTTWAKIMSDTDFINKKYYNLFINDGENNYPKYWMSSRCISLPQISPNTAIPNYNVRSVENGRVTYMSLLGPIVAPYPRLSLRPVITLSSDILVDTTDATRDGTEVGKAYMIKK